MSRKKKMTAWFLVLTMVCSILVGVPAKAEEVEHKFTMVYDVTDFDVASEARAIVYDTQGKAVGDTRYIVDYTEDGETREVSKYYKAEEIKVYEADWEEDVAIRSDREVFNVIVDVPDLEENDKNALCFKFQQEGTYFLVAGNNELRVYAYLDGGTDFYPEAEAADDTQIWDFRLVGAKNTFYFAVKDLESKNVGSVKFSAKVDEVVTKDVSSLITYTKIEDANIPMYKIEVIGDKSFELIVESELSDEEYYWTKKNSIWIDYVQTGFVFGEPIWDDETGTLTTDIDEWSYAKEMAGEMYSVRWVYLGTTTDGENYDKVPEDDVRNSSIKINNSNEYEIKEEEEWPFSSEKDTIIVKEGFAEYGIYGFYMKNDINITYNDETITIYKDLPAIGFYKNNKASFENYISDEYFMSETEMFEGMDIYVLPREDVKDYSYTLDTLDRTILVDGKAFDYEHISDEHSAGYYQSSKEFNKPIKISVEKCAGSFLRINGNIKWDEFTEPFERYLSLMYKNEDSIILEDNKPHEGFAGCLISESDYKVSQWWQMSGDVYYWVHGKTIQDVVDQLSAVAEAGEVTVDGKTYPISMTDYIWLNTSYFKYSEAFANSTQHVVTPSNIKGIIMQAGEEAPYAMYDYGNTKGYYQVQEWKNDEKILLLTQTPDSSNYYPVKELSETEAIAQQADYVVSDYENVWTKESLEDDGYEPVVDEDNNIKNAYPVYLPNLYVDATVEVKMIGNFGDSEANKQVQLGFYEGSNNKSIINGKEFSVANIGDDSVVLGNSENQVTVTVTEFKASTECSKAPINGESCEVTLGGENASLRDKIDIYQKGDDDYADAKKLAEGEELKVKLDVKEAKADDAEAKKVAEQVEKDCAKDKKKPSKVQYLDIDMKYQVGDRSPRAVTETLEEVDITMDIPDSFQQTDKHSKKRKYKVYRYHNGKVDVLDAEFDQDKKKLHFKTDKFSTYALVAEDVVATGIEITTNPVKLAYVEGEMFDETGMTVSLIYSDGTKEAVTGFVVSATNALALTDTAVTITYENYSVQIPISVTAKEVAPEIGTTEATTNGTCEVTGVAADGTVEVTFNPSKANKKAKKAKIDKTVTIDGKEYAVTAIADNAFSGNTKMTSVSIPDTVTKIGSNAFKGCTKLKKVTIPKSVTEIGKNAFYNCKKVSKVTIKGSSLTKIGNGAFRKCSSLKSVTIPEGVTEIGKDAFRDCKKLTTVTIKGTKIKTIGKNAFKNISSKSTIKVPKKKKADYKKLLKKSGYKNTVK